MAKMHWLGDSDAALKALALRLATEIESALDRSREFDDLATTFATTGDMDAYKRLAKLSAMCDATKLVGWLGPQLQGVLRDLGGTPHGRKTLNEAKPVGGRLAQLRAAAAEGAGADSA